MTLQSDVMKAMNAAPNRLENILNGLQLLIKAIFGQMLQASSVGVKVACLHSSGSAIQI